MTVEIDDGDYDDDDVQDVEVVEVVDTGMEVGGAADNTAAIPGAAAATSTAKSTTEATAEAEAAQATAEAEAAHRVAVAASERKAAARRADRAARKAAEEATAQAAEEAAAAARLAAEKAAEAAAAETAAAAEKAAAEARVPVVAAEDREQQPASLAPAAAFSAAAMSAAAVPSADDAGCDEPDEEARCGAVRSKARRARKASKELSAVTDGGGHEEGEADRRAQCPQQQAQQQAQRQAQREVQQRGQLPECYRVLSRGASPSGHLGLATEERETLAGGRLKRTRLEQVAVTPIAAAEAFTAPAPALALDPAPSNASGRRRMAAAGDAPPEHTSRSDGLVTEVDGLQLHLSAASSTGYRGVVDYSQSSKERDRPFKAQATAPRVCTLGHFATKVEAAVCYAKWALQEGRGQAVAVPEDMEAANSKAAELQAGALAAAAEAAAAVAAAAEAAAAKAASWSAGAKRNARSLGCFATAEEAALAHARSVDSARRSDERGGVLDSGPKAAAAQQGAAAAAPGAAGAAAAPTAASGSAWEAQRRGRSAAPEWQLAEAAAEPEAKRRCVSVSAVAPGSLSSAATDAKRRRRATGSELASPVQRAESLLFGRRGSAPEQRGQRHATDVAS